MMDDPRVNLSERVGRQPEGAADKTYEWINAACRYCDNEGVGAMENLLAQVRAALPKKPLPRKRRAKG